MAILYSITYKNEAGESNFQFLKLQIIADNQFHALKLSEEKALQLRMKVTKIEELHAVKYADITHHIFMMNGKAFDFNLVPEADRLV